jgi:hypothetical protein
MTPVTIQDELYSMIPIEGTSGFTLSKLDDRSSILDSLFYVGLEMAVDQARLRDVITQPSPADMLPNNQQFWDLLSDPVQPSPEQADQHVGDFLKEVSQMQDEWDSSLERLKTKHFLEKTDAITMVQRPVFDINLDALHRAFSTPFVISTQPSPSGPTSQDSPSS